MNEIQHGGSENNQLVQVQALVFHALDMCGDLEVFPAMLPALEKLDNMRCVYSDLVSNNFRIANLIVTFSSPSIFLKALQHRQAAWCAAAMMADYSLLPP